jgi:transposase-like protein
MSYRESSKTLTSLWGKISHQRLNNFINKSPAEENYFVRIRDKIKGYVKSRKIFYLDGNVIKVRYCKKAKAVKETIRIVMKETFTKGMNMVQLTYGFLENNYSQLLNKLIYKGEDLSKTVAIADGERKIEEAVVKTEIKGFQRCLWHFFRNLGGRLRSENVSEKGAESVVNEMKRLCYIRKCQLKNMYTNWKEVITERIKILEDYVECFSNDNKLRSAEYLERAIPNLFTYVRWFCSYNKQIWIGRTVNKLERLNRRITFRMKRIGAVWSPRGAKKMLSLIFSDYYNYSYAKVRPAKFYLEKCVVII